MRLALYEDETRKEMYLKLLGHRVDPERSERLVVYLVHPEGYTEIKAIGTYPCLERNCDR